MISYKILMTLSVIFIISSEAGYVNVATKVNNCRAYLSELGFSNNYGFLNYCIVRQFENIRHFMSFLGSVGIAFVNFTPGLHEMTVKEEILSNFYEDNFMIQSTHDLCTPLEYCHQRTGSGLRSYGFRSRANLQKCEEEITKVYKRITTVTLAINEDGVEWPEETSLTSQTYSKVNRFRNVIVSQNLNSNNFTRTTQALIEENVMLWPGSKQGYFIKLIEELKFQNKSEKYLTKTKWCLRYYNQ